jgi:MFS family permease
MFKAKRRDSMKKIEHPYFKALISACSMAGSAIGICNNTAGVFYSSVCADLHFLRGSFAFYATLSLLFQALVALQVPKLMKKFDYRFLLRIGILVSALSIFAMSFCRSLYQFYLLAIVQGIFTGLYGSVPIAILINRWFVKNNGSATGIALSLSGFCGAAASFLLGKGIAAFGWRMGYRFMALLLIAIALPAFVLHLPFEPEKAGLNAYGYAPAFYKESVRPESLFSYKQLPFLLLCLFTLMHTSITGIAQHLSSIATSRQMSAELAASLLSAAMMGNIFFKLLIGRLADHIGAPKACAGMMVLNAVSLLMMLSPVSNSAAGFLLSAFLFGSVYSVGAVGISLLTRTFFDADVYAKAYSVIGFCISLGSASSLSLIGYVYDFCGTYTPVFVLAVLIHVLNLTILFFLVLYFRKRQSASAMQAAVSI